MNTIGSVYYGWAFLICCGAGSYYFAKRSINADRHERAALDQERRQRQNRQMAAATHPKIGPGPVQTKGAAETEGMGNVKQKLQEQQSGEQYEARAPFRSQKGDRFS